MMRFVFVSIPSLLFEPLAICALLGCIIAFWKYRKKHGGFFWIITGTLFFIFSWRLAFHFIMASKRYSTILLYPAVIFSTCFCFYLKDMGTWFCTHVFHCSPAETRKICRLIPVVALSALAIACLAKALHYNPYGLYVVKIGETLKKDLVGKKFRLFSTWKEQNRIAFYSGQNVAKVLRIGDEQRYPLSSLLKEKIDHKENGEEYQYFAFFLKKGAPVPNYSFVGLDPKKGKWECLCREYTSRKKDREMVLYRFSPLRPNIQQWDKKIPELPRDNLVKNGDFETVLTGVSLENKRKYYKKKGLLSYATPDRTFPSDWTFALGNNHAELPDFRIITDTPLAGKYSLSADAENVRDLFVLLSAPIPNPQGDFVFHFFVRNDGKSDSTLNVRLVSWVAAQKKNYIIKDLTLYLQKEKTYCIHAEILQEEIPESATNFYIHIYSKGKFTFDQFCILPIEKKK